MYHVSKFFFNKLIIIVRRESYSCIELTISKLDIFMLYSN